MGRRLRYQVAVSLDGFIAGPKGEADWIVMDPSIDFGALFSEFDTLVMGRKTHEVMTAQGGKGTMPGFEVVVFSRTLPASTRKGLRIVRDDPREVVTALKAKPGKDIWLFGGGVLFRSLLDAGLVDTVELAVVPVLLGSGVPLIPPGKWTKLILADYKTLPASGIVVLSYAVPGVYRPVASDSIRQRETREEEAKRRSKETWEVMNQAAFELAQRGFVVLSAAVPADRIDRLATAYDDTVSSAIGDDLRIGSATTRLTDFVNRGAEFDEVYVFPPLLEACRSIIGEPFVLSSFHARTLRPNMPAQDLHVDVPRHSADWPLVGFILMVEEFRPDNGATRFVPGSHQWMADPESTIVDRRADHDGQVLACGPPGSLIVFNGSTWHGHSANRSSSPRRSLQGAFIPRTGRAATDFGARMSPSTRARLSEVARQVLALS